MQKIGYCQYYVEGEDEQKLLSVLKTEMGLIVPGKIEKLNVVQEVITRIRLMQLKKGTTVVLIFDSDVGNPNILKQNIQVLEKHSSVKQVICIPQVKNLEDELIRSCNIKQIKELLGSKSNKEYKHDLLTEKNLKMKLIKSNFDMKQFWNQKPTNEFKWVENGAERIKRN